MEEMLHRPVLEMALILLAIGMELLQIAQVSYIFISVHLLGRASRKKHQDLGPETSSISMQL